MRLIHAKDTEHPLNAAGFLGEKLVNAATNENEIVPQFILDGARVAGYPNALRLLWNCEFHPGESGFSPYEAVRPMNAMWLEINWQNWPKAFKRLAAELNLSEAALKRKLTESIETN